jgi:predicted Fe-Mo cluster-binding NifX family protein
MRIAIPIWRDRVSPVLDTAARLLLVETQNRTEADRFELVLEGGDLAKRCFRIGASKADILICGAVSRPFSRMLLAAGIQLIPDISGDAEEVLQAFLNGNLVQSKFLMPGCRRARLQQAKRSMALGRTRARIRKGRGADSW